MRESIPNQRHRPPVRRPGVMFPSILALVMIALLSCSGSMLLDQSHVDEVRALIGDGWRVQAEARAAELLDQSRPGEGASALARAELMGLHASALRRSNPEKRAEARELANQALQLKIDLVGASHPSVADTWYDLGIFHEVMGNPDEALGAYEKSLDIRRSALGTEHPSVALSLIQLSSIQYYTVKDAESALALLDEARLIQEKSLPEVHPDVATRLMAVGYIKQGLGEYTAACRCYEAGLEIRQQCLRPDHPFTGICHSSLGALLNNLGEFAGARRHKEKALEIDLADLGPDHLFIAHDLTGIAQLLHKMGDLDEAERLFRRALAITEENLGDTHRESLKAVVKLAILLRDQGEYQEASELYTHVLAHWDSENDTDVEQKVMLLNRYGSVLQLLGRDREAEETIEEALTLALDKLGKNHQRTRSVMLNRAALLQIKGKTEEADQLFRESLENYDEIPGGLLPIKLFGLTSHAQVLAELGRREEALTSALLAESLAREHFRITAKSLETGLALKYAAWGMDSLHTAVSIVADSAEDDPQHFREDTADTIIRCRALVLDELAARAQTVRESADPHVAALHLELRAARKNLAELAVKGTATDSVDLTQAAKTKERVERDLAEASISYRNEQQEHRIGLEDVRENLPEDCALVAYLRYFDSSPAADGEDGDEKESYLALILHDPRAPVRIIRLGEAEEIDRLVLEWRDELLKGTAADVPGLNLEASYRRAGQVLRRQIWDPLVPHLGSADQVFLVPDSALHLVSFSALPTGAETYLVEDGPTIHYLSAEREIARQDGSDPAQPAAAAGLLLLGNPQFGATGSEPPANAPVNQQQPDSLLLRYASLEFTPLPGTAQEIHRVAALWRRHLLKPGQENGSLVTLTGEQANEPAFRQEALNCSTLHLATHAYFLQPESGDRSDRLNPHRIQTGQRSFQLSRPDENPLLRTGLALAGANLHHEGGDDGILTAEEIVSLDLGAVRLAVLSACDTGLGTVQSGEGVFGLRRAFRLAGVNTVINSLWPVEDESTAEWMEVFYATHLDGKASTAKAAHRASLDILNHRREQGLSGHPFFWAAFVTSGDWR